MYIAIFIELAGVQDMKRTEIKRRPLSDTVIANLEAELKEYFGAKQVLWLNHGYLAGDDTDSHVDTLARFCDKSTIAYVKCDDVDDEHYEELKKMKKELRQFRTSEGGYFRLIPLPMADAVYEDGERLPAIALQLQEAVKESVGDSTGLRVNAVNVNVERIVFGEEK